MMKPTGEPGTRTLSGRGRSQRRLREPSRRYLLGPTIEGLEDRTLLAVSASVSNGTAVFRRSAGNTIPASPLFFNGPRKS